MRARTGVIAIITLLAGCNDASGPTVMVTAHILNGPTSAMSLALPAPPSTNAAAAVPGNGYWLLSPDNVSLKIVRIQLTGGPGGGGATVDCVATFDRFKIGLASLGDCPFPAPAGTYNGMNVVFSSTYSVQINDATNGFYTTSSGIVTAAPVGGAQGLVVTVDGLSNLPDEMYASMPFTTPFVVSPNTPASLNVVIGGIQFFHVNVNGGVVAQGWPGTPYTNAFKPIVVAFPETPSNVAFYSQQAIGTAGSYCAASCVAASPTGVASVEVYYANPTSPLMVMGQLNGYPLGCGPFSTFFVVDARGYLGRDSGGNIGWAMATSLDWGQYAAELRFAETATLGGTTTLYCKNRTTDPAPSGGSYASGAPAIAVPANSLGTYVLVAK